MVVELRFDLVGGYRVEALGERQLPATIELVARVNAEAVLLRRVSLSGTLRARDWLGTRVVEGALGFALPTAAHAVRPTYEPRLVLTARGPSSGEPDVRFEGTLEQQLPWPGRWFSFKGPWLAAGSGVSARLGEARFRFDAQQDTLRVLRDVRFRW